MDTWIRATRARARRRGQGVSFDLLLSRFFGEDRRPVRGDGQVGPYNG